MDIIDVAFQVITNGISLDLETLFVITWYILFNRNQVVYESTSHPPSQILDSNLRLAKDYKGALSPTIQQRGYRVSHCFLPQPGFHKVNVDGATSPNGTISNISVIIHDSSGHIIAVLSKPLLIHYPPDTVEAITLENDIILAHEMNIPCVIIESNSLSTVQSIIAKKTGGPLDHIFCEIQSSLLYFSS